MLRIVASECSYVLLPVQYLRLPAVIGIVLWIFAIDIVPAD